MSGSTCRTSGITVSTSQHAPRPRSAYGQKLPTNTNPRRAANGVTPATTGRRRINKRTPSQRTPRQRPAPRRVPRRVHTSPGHLPRHAMHAGPQHRPARSNAASSAEGVITPSANHAAMHSSRRTRRLSVSSSRTFLHRCLALQPHYDADRRQRYTGCGPAACAAGPAPGLARAIPARCK